MRSIADIIGGKRRQSQLAAGFAGTRSESIYRLQVGLSGLAAIVLIVALANVIMDRAHRTENNSVPDAAATVAPTAQPTDQNDPLAEAGVVPDLPASPTPSPTREPAIVPEQGNAAAPQ